MITTLQQLENYPSTKIYKLKQLLSELKNFIIIFIIVSITTSIITNWKLFNNSLNSIFENDNQPKQNLIINTGLDINKTKKNENLEKQKLIDKIFELSNGALTTDVTADTLLQSQLKTKVNTYDLGFNTLPPDNRLIIPKVGENLPLIVPNFNKPIGQITQEDFDKLLYHGVVKYPTTAIPGNPGNTMIFGHTSYESRKHNPYATVFQALGKLENGDLIQIVRKGKLLTYKVINKKVISPKHIKKEYEKYTNKNINYLTLIGCYPFGSDRERIIVVAQQI